MLTKSILKHLLQIQRYKRTWATSTMGKDPRWEWRFFFPVDANDIASFNEIEPRTDVYFPCNSDHGFKLRGGEGLEWKEQLETQPVDTTNPAFGSAGLWKKRKTKVAHCIKTNGGVVTVDNVALKEITNVTVLEGVRVTCTKRRKQTEQGNVTCEDTMCEFTCSIHGVLDMHAETWRSMCVESKTFADVVANLPNSGDLPVTAVVAGYPGIVCDIARRARDSLNNKQSKQ